MGVDVGQAGLRGEAGGSGTLCEGLQHAGNHQHGRVN
jgi:hypothetical protein